MGGAVGIDGLVRVLAELGDVHRIQYAYTHSLITASICNIV